MFNVYCRCILNVLKFSLSDVSHEIFRQTTKEQIKTDVQSDQPTHSLIITLIVVLPRLYNLFMSLVVRKPVFGVSDRVRHKPGFAVTEDG